MSRTPAQKRGGSCNCFRPDGSDHWHIAAGIEHASARAPKLYAAKYSSTSSSVQLQTHRWARAGLIAPPV